MLIAYVGQDEVIVCTEETEKSMLEEYFAKHTGRDVNEYDREVKDCAVWIKPSISLS